jgi:O-antigen/teichoic acid export membrane protein
LIGRYWGALELGLYSRSYQLLRLPLEQILSPVSSVAIPALSRLSDEAENYKKAYLNIIEKIAMITMPGITLMCATSDWLVLLLLGPQWADTGRIFMFLGIAAVVQPITGTCNWLLSTQGRTREMFKWSFIAAAISVSSILIGLKWGAIGVAACYALFDLCLHTPLLLWYAGRKGPVRTLDFYVTLMPSFCASVGSLAVLLFLRSWLISVDSLFIRLAIALVLSVITSVAIFASIPAGRKALHGFKHLIILFSKSRRSPVSDAE